MVQLDGDSLTLESFQRIVQRREQVELSEEARSKILRGRKYVDKAAAGDTRVYSINTGFGALSKVSIPKDQLEKLQVNLIRSHCSGVGPPHTEEESRAILLLRINVLAKGFSGSRIELVEQLIAMLNREVHPVIPSKGSVGASGDLAPLAHLAAVAIGEGEAFFQGSRLSGAAALRAAGMKPVQLAAKEGLTLINGTQQMTGWGALILLQARELLDLSDLICSASLDSVLGSRQPFQPWIHTARAHPGQKTSAGLIASFLEESEILKSHAECDRVQDAYSFRCAPQVHGAARDLVSYVEKSITTEFNAATDNPLIHPDTGEILCNGNFHGQPIAFALDMLAMAMSELGSLSERRIAKLIEPAFSSLPAFLVKHEGINSGFMIPHVTAASLVAENRILSHPGSTDSIPTSNEKEDHVSMGPNCARKAAVILQNTQYILAIEALAAAQALDLRLPLRGGVGAEFLHRFVRRHVPTLDEDRVMSPDMELMAELFRSSNFHTEAKQEGLWDLAKSGRRAAESSSAKDGSKKQHSG